MFVPDLLHEFELGVWKAVLTHLLRILHAEGRDRIQIFNNWCTYTFHNFVLLVLFNSTVIIVLGKSQLTEMARFAGFITTSQASENALRETTKTSSRYVLHKCVFIYLNVRTY